MVILRECVEVHDVVKRKSKRSLLVAEFIEVDVLVIDTRMCRRVVFFAKNKKQSVTKYFKISRLFFASFLL